jgi:type I restriction enzyme S subunit
VARIESLFTQLDAGVAALKRARAALKRYKASVLKAACEGRLVPQDPNDEPAEEVLRRIMAERGEKFTPPEGELAELPGVWRGLLNCVNL